eukprot:TRINITY_DN756_c0_g1_i3.p1 TRINITY_DN756_c0_g1~~TRINITY_DN756_c0_g1_i3.p1  ORF type:complete len:147 (-),score=15.25 TRINITY_DN756_c0_g1_i3:76-516(-)
MSSYQLLAEDADGLLVGAPQTQGSYQSFPDPKTSQPAILDSQKLSQIVVDSAQNGQEMVTMNQVYLPVVSQIFCAEHPDTPAMTTCHQCGRVICASCTVEYTPAWYRSTQLICSHCSSDFRCKGVMVFFVFIALIIIYKVSSLYAR